MMTRKDYVSTAEILEKYKDTIDLIIIYNLIRDVGGMFREDNELFLSERFIVSKFADACWDGN
jgi:hypothetical protein